jgi:hypothetical protein
VEAQTRDRIALAIAHKVDKRQAQLTPIQLALRENPTVLLPLANEIVASCELSLGCPFGPGRER